MKVEAMMRRTVVTVRPDTPLRDVARILVEHGISGVPVVDRSGGVVGVVSEADFVLKEQGLPERRRGPLFRLFTGSEEDRATLLKVHATTAGEAMTSPAIAIEPSTSLRDAARLMTERRVNRLPVIQDGRLIGIVTRSDVVRAFTLTDQELRALIVEDVLHRAMGLEPEAVEVAVANGYARVTGTVEKRSDAPILERLVAEVPGVMGCEVTVDWRLDDTGIEPEAADLVNPPFGPA